MDEEKQKKIEELEQTVSHLKATLSQASEQLRDLTGDRPRGARGELMDEGEVIEGIFDGKDMVGPDGKHYTVPANYASKSKLVEGDNLKLTIALDGGFIYKQIGPIMRKRLRSTLVYDEDAGEYQAMVEGGKLYKLLKASVTYFRGEEGDEVVILVPEDRPSKWAAVENIIKVIS